MPRAFAPPAAAARPRSGLRLGPPDDVYEREAERVAEAVTRDGGVAGALARTPPPWTLQRLCPECEEEEAAGALQRKCAACAAEEEDVRRQGEAGSAGCGAPEVPAATAERIGRLRGGGVPLSPGQRGYFEPRLGRDLAPVRLHTGGEAAVAAREVSARAFTVGPDIAFASGAYDPASGTGRRLLAHELVHTVQQGAAGAESGVVHTASAPILRRQPSGDKAPKTSKSRPSDKKADLEVEIRLWPWRNKIGIDFSDVLFEREVPSLVFKAGKVPPGFTLEGGAKSVITHYWILTGPPDQDLASVSGLLNERIAKGLADERAKQRDEEQQRSSQSNEPAVLKARARFRKRHDGHSVNVLDNIDAALRRVTRNNPNLLIAYYDYYADNKLTDDTDDLDVENDLGTTSSGDTDINPRVLRLESAFKTSDRLGLSLLGGTLIHEYVHTPHGPKGFGHEQVPKEAKAYGVELVLAERTGDDARVDVINARYTNDIMDQRLGGNQVFRSSQNTMRALYKVIDSGRTQSDARIAGDISAEEARRMSVEFISRNEEDYGTALKAFIAKYSR